MTHDELKQHLGKAERAGTLMTPKHDPNNLSTTYKDYRTVLSYDMAKDLKGFIDSGNYKVTEYENRRSPNTPQYFEIEPIDVSKYSVPSSGVAANSPFATSALDRLVAVSGKNQGWHLFGESSAAIQLKIASGDLDIKVEL